MSVTFYCMLENYISLSLRRNPKMIKMLKNEKGQGMAEYALIIAVVAILAVGLLAAFRGNIQTAFENIGGDLVANT